MGNLIVGMVIVAILSLAIGKIVYDKKRGVKCIGCPHGEPSSTKVKIEFRK